jgi:hypothetical protein
MTLSPDQLSATLDKIADQLGRDIRDSLDLDELATLNLATAAQLLGVPITAAARILPVIEVGPRTRRVRVCDYKALIAARTVKGR